MFPIRADDHLIVRDDSSFDRRWTFVVSDQHVISLHAAVFAQRFANLFSRRIPADNANDVTACPKRRDICEHVRCPAKMH